MLGCSIRGDTGSYTEISFVHQWPRAKFIHLSVICMPNLLSCFQLDELFHNHYFKNQYDRLELWVKSWETKMLEDTD